jgi:PAS domain S-box-containing protein
MDGAVLAVNSDMVVTMYNQTAERYYGSTADEMIGKSIKEILPDGYQDLTTYKAITSKKKVTEERKVNIGGKQVYFYNKADVLLDEEENIVGAICVSHDITELKVKHELMLKQEKLATIGQMAAGIAHELRNPLTAVRGFAQLLSEKTTPQNQQLFTIMLSEMDRMEKLVQDFLQLSRPKEPELKNVCINGIITKLYSLTNSQCSKQNINIITELKSDLPPVLVDDDQITQLLLNLIRNAIEAVTDREPGIITIKTNFTSGDDGICIQVIDNGQGIAPENLPKLGMPFFTTKGHGTGLGLAICYNIVKQHGGSLRVNSNVNKGTCFKIYLPCQTKIAN